MRRLAVLPFLALGLLLPPLAFGQPAETKAAGDTPPSADWTIRPIGASTQTLKISGANKLWLKGDGGTRRGNSKVNGIQIEASTNILLTDITLTGWFQGVRVNNSRGIELRRVTASRNKQQGILFCNTNSVVLRDCVGERTAVQHSFYAGCYQNGKSYDYTLEGCTFSGSKLAEVQWNQETGAVPATNVRLTNCRISNDTFALNMLGVKDFVLDGCTVTSKKKSMSLDKPYGRPWPSTGVGINGTAIAGKVYLGTGSKFTRK